DLLDVARLAHPGAQKLEHLVVVHQPPVAAIDDGLVTDVGAGGDQQVDPLALGVVGGAVVQVAVEVGGGGDAPAVIVQVQVHHAVVPYLEGPFHLGVGQ